MAGPLRLLPRSSSACQDGRLDRHPRPADDLRVTFTSRTARNQRRGLGLLITASMLLFAHTCAQTSMTCGIPMGASGDAHCEDTADHDAHCGDSDGCEHGNQDDCSHRSICCSTWAQPPATLTVSPPVAVTLLSAAPIQALAPNEAFAAGPLPVPAESPPPRVSILRL